MVDSSPHTFRTTASPTQPHTPSIWKQHFLEGGADFDEYLWLTEGIEEIHQL